MKTLKKAPKKVMKKAPVPMQPPMQAPPMGGQPMMKKGGKAKKK